MQLFGSSKKGKHSDANPVREIYNSAADAEREVLEEIFEPELNGGESVLFTDMDGIVSTYTVEALETLDPDDTETVLGGGSDLVLYTCTVGGGARVAAFCNRAE